MTNQVSWTQISNLTSVGADSSMSTSLSSESTTTATTSKFLSASPSTASDESSIKGLFNQTMFVADNSTFIADKDDLNSTVHPSFSPRPSSTTQPSPYSSNALDFPSPNGLAPLVPSSKAQSIHDSSCGTEKAKFLIRTGDASAHADCISSCLDGLCCFTSELGYSLVDSCYEGNEHKCSQYEACLILKVDSEQDGQYTNSNTTVGDNLLSESNDSKQVNSTTNFNNAMTSGSISGSANQTRFKIWVSRLV